MGYCASVKEIINQQKRLLQSHDKLIMYQIILAKLKISSVVDNNSALWLKENSNTRVEYPGDVYPDITWMVKILNYKIEIYR